MVFCILSLGILFMVVFLLTYILFLLKKIAAPSSSSTNIFKKASTLLAKRKAWKPTDVSRRWLEARQSGKEVV